MTTFLEHLNDNELSKSSMAFQNLAFYAGKKSWAQTTKMYAEVGVKLGLVDQFLFQETV